jgi:hypothetical protein
MLGLVVEFVAKSHKNPSRHMWNGRAGHVKAIPRTVHMFHCRKIERCDLALTGYSVDRYFLQNTGKSSAIADRYRNSKTGHLRMQDYLGK